MNIEALQRAATSWIGTPFRPHACVKGAGVDCLRLAISIYQEAGLPLDVTLPAYGMQDWRNRSGPGPARLWLESSPLFRPVDKPEPGDCVLLRIERADHHFGIVMDETRFIHAIQDYGVILSSLGDTTYRDRIAAIYRPTA